MLPANGARLIMASDGLWDLMSFTKAVQLTRSKPTSAATQALIQVRGSCGAHVHALVHGCVHARR